MVRLHSAASEIAGNQRFDRLASTKGLASRILEMGQLGPFRAFLSRGQNPENALLLHQLFDFAEHRGWCATNPCTRVDRPQVEPKLDIRFLVEGEFNALLEAVDVAHEPLG
jgi:hypothetical protein